MPIFSRNGSDYLSQGIGDRIREQRRLQGLTLKELAGKLSVSLATLSAIENSKLVLDIERLVAISTALNVGPDVLFPRSATRHFEITRRDSPETAAPRSPLHLLDPSSGEMTDSNNLFFRPMAPWFVGKHIEPFYVEVNPVEDNHRQFICYHHEEFFFVLRGEVECLIQTPKGLETEVLGPGDCMYFWSYLPHCIRSTRRVAAHCIHMLYAAHGATDSDHTDTSMGAVHIRDLSYRNLTNQIAARIASLRQARGMSACDFAGSIGVSLRRLSDLERGRKPVSIDLLLEISNRFRKPVDYFLEGTLINDAPYASVLRALDVASLTARKRRLVSTSNGALAAFRPLADAFTNRGMFPYYVRFRAEEEATPPLIEHHGQEFVFVLSGEVTLHTLLDHNQITERLSAGDSCFIDSTVPHRFTGAGLNPYDRAGAETINVFWCPLGEKYLFVD